MPAQKRGLLSANGSDGLEAEAVLAIFERMLWLNPSDNQGERFNLHWIREGRPWEETVD